MKGPGLRLKGDVRRTWRCPVCGSELPAGGHVTTLLCTCEKPGPFMRLMEPRRTARPEAEPLDVYFECAPDDETVAPSAGVDDAAGPALEVQTEVVAGSSAGEAIELVPIEGELLADEPEDDAQEDVAPVAELLGEQPAASLETTPAEPTPAERSPMAAEQPAAPKESGQPKRERGRKSRGSRRKRGRRRKSGNAGGAGPG